MTIDQFVIFFAGILGGALRVGAPFLFVSLGECLTEKSGRINLGLEGVLVLSAMSAFGASWLSGSPWVGVLVAALTGALLAGLHGVLCSLPRVNDIATGIALMLLGMGLAFYLGKPLIQPQAPQLPAIALGNWSDSAAVRSALQINVLVPIGLAIAVALVIFARWSPLRCVGAALMFGGAGAIGPALQSIGIGWGYHLFNIVPYVLTLLILVLTCKPGGRVAGSPGELGATN